MLSHSNEKENLGIVNSGRFKAVTFLATLPSDTLQAYLWHLMH